MMKTNEGNLFLQNPMNDRIFVFIQSFIHNSQSMIFRCRRSGGFLSIQFDTYCC